MSTAKPLKGTSAQAAASSKKFIAYLLATITWTLLLSTSLYLWASFVDEWRAFIVIFMIVVKGCVEVGYILGQAGLDAFTSLVDAITPDSVFGKALGKKQDEQPPEGQ